MLDSFKWPLATSAEALAGLVHRHPTEQMLATFLGSSQPSSAGDAGAGSTSPLRLDGLLAFSRPSMDAMVVTPGAVVIGLGLTKAGRRTRFHTKAETEERIWKMKIEMERAAAWLQPEEVHLDVPLKDSTHALEFIASAVAEHHGLEPAPIFRALSRREQSGSTALGGGFAVPHARIPGIDRPLTILVRSARPLDFKATDHEPVTLMLGILVPDQGDRQDHLRLLALVAELFSNPRFRAEMDTATDARAIAESLRAGIAQLQG